MTALATPDDVAAVYRPASDADAGRVARLIDMVSGAVAPYLGGTSFDRQTTTARVRPYDGVVRLPQRPVISVEEVRQYGVVMDPGSYTWRPNGYLDYVAPLDTWQWSYVEPLAWAPVPLEVTWTFGYDTVPADLAMVVAERVAGALQASESGESGALRAASLDGYSESYATVAPGEGEWSGHHLAILRRYRRSGLASLRLTS